MAVTALFLGKYPQMKEVYIISSARTPLGSFGGVLTGFSATQLGAHAVKAAVARAGIPASEIQECIFGNVLSANLGQAPARQVAIFGGLAPETICTTVNKVCASAAKAIMFAAQNIMTGQQDCVIAGGCESMTNSPYYLERNITGYKPAHIQLIDGMLKDGLWDVYNDYHMAIAAEDAVAELQITRDEQDEYCIRSYQRATDANENGHLKDEIAPIEVTIGKKGEKQLVDKDEEYKKVIYEKIKTLKPVFKADGTITAANASTINDGACAYILMSREKAEKLGCKPLAAIRGFADAEQLPAKFPTSPSKAIPKAIERAGLKSSDIDYYEVHEAFSAVAVITQKLLGISNDRINLHGGAVSIGHPIGMSGGRIVGSLITVLNRFGGKYGAIGVCNGGGGASSIVIEKL